jgi:hypothetical protein
MQRLGGESLFRSDAGRMAASKAWIRRRLKNKFIKD